MKHKPQTYAQTLLSLLESGAKPKEIASSFWLSLQKNKQSKDLKKILECLEIESAKQEGMIYAKVISAAPLTDEKLQEIEVKLSKQFKEKIIIKNIIKKSCIAGVVVKVDDTEIDLSTEGKINRLGQKLQSSK